MVKFIELCAFKYFWKICHFNVCYNRGLLSFSFSLLVLYSPSRARIDVYTRHTLCQSELPTIIIKLVDTALYTTIKGRFKVLTNTDTHTDISIRYADLKDKIIACPRVLSINTHAVCILPLVEIFVNQTSSAFEK